MKRYIALILMLGCGTAYAAPHELTCETFDIWTRKGLTMGEELQNYPEPHYFEGSVIWHLVIDEDSGFITELASENTILMHRVETVKHQKSGIWWGSGHSLKLPEGRKHSFLLPKSAKHVGDNVYKLPSIVFEPNITLNLADLPIRYQLP